MKTMTVRELEAVIAAGRASGDLSDDSEVRVWTGWEGPENLDASADIVTSDGAAYLLVRKTD
jgi:hypothetical protein